MALGIDKQIEELNELIGLDFDAIGAYTSAIDEIDERVVREPLIQFRADHQRHVQNLSAIVLRLGGQPREASSIKGAFKKTMTKAAGLGGIELSLKAMRVNEELLNKAYAHHLALDFPEEIKLVIRQNYADEQGHLAWVVDALRNRVWEADAGAHL